jgi:predicted aconitase
VVKVERMYVQNVSYTISEANVDFFKHLGSMLTNDGNVLVKLNPELLLHRHI